jgi:predicted ribosomally synthesized peptide with nif11-like leader
MFVILSISTMSEQQLSALLAKLKDDAILREKLQNASDIDAFLAIAKQEGFELNKAQLIKYQARQVLELSDAELEATSGGQFTIAIYCQTIAAGYTCFYGCGGNETVLGAC